jgi:hypothetical protein
LFSQAQYRSRRPRSRKEADKHNLTTCINPIRHLMTRVGFVKCFKRTLLKIGFNMPLVGPGCT